MRFPRIAALFVALFVVASHPQPVTAASMFFSTSGSGTACTPSAPCSMATAISEAQPNSEIACADSVNNTNTASISTSLTIDCAGTTASVFQIIVSNGATVVVRNLTLADNFSAVTLQSGTLILENVHITGAGMVGIVAQPTSPSTLIVKNSVIDSGNAGVQLKPSPGGNLSARFDHVTIAGNLGGGIKVDTTSAPVSVAVTDSEVSNNGGNGINTVGGAGGSAVVSIEHSVIAKNAAAGLQANGATAGVLVANTLLDENTAGALSIVAGGNIFSYGNNRVVGSQGSNFTSTTPLK
jgi:hypothetical protein